MPTMRWARARRHPVRHAGWSGAPRALGSGQGDDPRRKLAPTDLAAGCAASVATSTRSIEPRSEPR